MKVNKKGESDGGSLSTVAKFIVLGIAVFVVIFYFIPLGEKTETAIGGATDFQCEISPELCEESNNLNSLELEEKESYETIEEFARVHSIEKAKLLAFLSVESSGQAFDGNHPTVRFECTKFNNISNEEVPCEINSRNKYGIPEHTNLQAFNRALEVNRREALLSSSYGLGQVMGFNYNLAGYGSVEDYYEAMFKEENQVLAFLTFIENRNPVLISELQKEDTDWAVIARNYNGEDYKSNNYDVRLEEEYQRLS